MICCTVGSDWLNNATLLVLAPRSSVRLYFYFLSLEVEVDLCVVLFSLHACCHDLHIIMVLQLTLSQLLVITRTIQYCQCHVS